MRYARSTPSASVGHGDHPALARLEVQHTLAADAVVGAAAATGGRSRRCRPAGRARNGLGGESEGSTAAARGGGRARPGLCGRPGRSGGQGGAVGRGRRRAAPRRRRRQRRPGLRAVAGRDADAEAAGPGASATWCPRRRAAGRSGQAGGQEGPRQQPPRPASGAREEWQDSCPHCTRAARNRARGRRGRDRPNAASLSAAAPVGLGPPAQLTGRSASPPIRAADTPASGTAAAVRRRSRPRRQPQDRWTPEQAHEAFVMRYANGPTCSGRGTSAAKAAVGARRGGGRRRGTSTT